MLEWMLRPRQLLSCTLLNPNCGVFGCHWPRYQYQCKGNQGSYSITFKGLDLVRMALASPPYVIGPGWGSWPHRNVYINRRVYVYFLFIRYTFKSFNHKSKKFNLQKWRPSSTFGFPWVHRPANTNRSLGTPQTTFPRPSKVLDLRLLRRPTNVCFFQISLPKSLTLIIHRRCCKGLWRICQDSSASRRWRCRWQGRPDKARGTFPTPLPEVETNCMLTI